MLLAIKPLPAWVDEEITYTVNFTDAFTPSLTINGDSNPLRPFKKAANQWLYHYVVKSTDTIVNANVNFAKPTVVSLSAENISSMIYANDASNSSNVAFTTYVNNIKLHAFYNNGTNALIIADRYELKEGSWDIKGGEYTYRVSVGTVSCELRVSVKIITATIENLPDIFIVQDNAGIAKQQLKNLLTTKIKIFYNGENIPTFNDNVNLYWDLTELQDSFGKTPTGKNPINIMAYFVLPSWASGGMDNININVHVSAKTPLHAEQIKVTINDWVYGEKTNLPIGSITVNDANASLNSFKYFYSGTCADGQTFTDLAQLPLSSSIQVLWNWVGKTYDTPKTKLIGRSDETQGYEAPGIIDDGGMSTGKNIDCGYLPAEINKGYSCSDTEWKNPTNHNCLSTCNGESTRSCTLCHVGAHYASCETCGCQDSSAVCYPCVEWESIDYECDCRKLNDGTWECRTCSYDSCVRDEIAYGCPECSGYNSCSHTYCNGTYRGTGRYCGYYNSGDHEFWYDLYQEDASSCPANTSTKTPENVMPPSSNTGTEWKPDGTSLGSCKNQTDLGNKVSVPSGEPY